MRPTDWQGDLAGQKGARRPESLRGPSQSAICRTTPSPGALAIFIDSRADFVFTLDCCAAGARRFARRAKPTVHLELLHDR